MLSLNRKNGRGIALLKQGAKLPMKRKKRTARELEIDPDDFGVIPAYQENEEMKGDRAHFPMPDLGSNLLNYE